jgi:hypothetical protein
MEIIKKDKKEEKRENKQKFRNRRSGAKVGKSHESKFSGAICGKK